jgi:hypothetical protein
MEKKVRQKKCDKKIAAKKVRQKNRMAVELRQHNHDNMVGVYF